MHTLLIPQKLQIVKDTSQFFKPQGDWSGPLPHVKESLHLHWLHFHSSLYTVRNTVMKAVMSAAENQALQRYGSTEGNWLIIAPIAILTEHA